MTPSDDSTTGAPTVATVGTTFAYGTTQVRAALLSFAVSSSARIRSESLLVHAAGREVTPTELAGDHGTRLHLVEDVGTGWLEVTYQAEVELDAPGERAGTDPSAEGQEYQRWVFGRQSRYAESDRLAAMAARTFPGLRGVERLQAVAQWTHDHLRYVSGSSRGTDGAVDTLLQGAGVCRDFAHVVVALMRALGSPARLVSVYAPGLAPMDFHAVAEVYVEGAWRIVDATQLAPRASMIRIATGRDAADTAFLTTSGGRMRFNRQAVTATITEGRLPTEDPGELITLA